MSVSKLQHEPVSIGVPPAANPPHTFANCVSLPKADPNAEEFWMQFNRTLDDFFATIEASKAHIQRLTERLAEREKRIDELSDENLALQEQLKSRQMSAQNPGVEPPVASAGDPSAQLRARRSIWSRLSGLERDPTPIENRFDRRR